MYLLTCMFRSGSRGEITAVQTSKNTLFSKKAVVIATGCWTGSLMPNLIRDLGVELSFPVKPRKVRISRLFHRIFFDTSRLHIHGYTVV